MATTEPGLRDLPTRLARHRRLRLLPFLVAGAALLPTVEWVVHGLAPTTQTRAVLVESGVERRGTVGRVSTTHDSVAVTADGSALDLTAGGGSDALTDLDVGSPVVLTRSTADGRVLEVRTPQGVADLHNHGMMIFLRIGGVLVAAAGLWLGRATPRAPVAAVVLVPLGALLTVLVLPRGHDMGAYPFPVRDAMHGYLDPPTTTPPDPNRTTFRVDEVVPIGTRTEVGPGTFVTVTGAPRPGLPDGADPETGRWFSTVHVPLRAEPAPDARRAGYSLPTNTLLIGQGRGRTVRLDQDPACAGAPQALPEQSDGPREGYVCFAVPDDFTPRYLVFRNDDVAIELPAGPVH